MLLLPLLFAPLAAAADLALSVAVADQAPVQATLHDVTGGPPPHLVLPGSPPTLLGLTVTEPAPGQFRVAATLEQLTTDAAGRWSRTVVSRPVLIVLPDTPGRFEVGHGQGPPDLQLELTVRP